MSIRSPNNKLRYIVDLIVELNHIRLVWSLEPSLQLLFHAETLESNVTVNSYIRRNDEADECWRQAESKFISPNAEFISPIIIILIKIVHNCYTLRNAEKSYHVSPSDWKDRPSKLDLNPPNRTLS